MTLQDVLFALRDQLQTAYQHNDKAQADKLFVIFDELLQIALPSRHTILLDLLYDLKDTARDIVMGARGKSSVPTVDAIKAAFVISTEAS